MRCGRGLEQSTYLTLRLSLIHILLARDAITREQAELRLSRQHDDEFFRAHADFVIENNYGEHNPDGGALERSCLLYTSRCV